MQAYARLLDLDGKQAVKLIDVEALTFNFSFHNIIVPLVIPENQQMVVCHEINLEDELTLGLSSELCLL